MVTVIVTIYTVSAAAVGPPEGLTQARPNYVIVGKGLTAGTNMHLSSQCKRSQRCIYTYHLFQRKTHILVFQRRTYIPLFKRRTHIPYLRGTPHVLRRTPSYSQGSAHHLRAATCTKRLQSNSSGKGKYIC